MLVSVFPKQIGCLLGIDPYTPAGGPICQGVILMKRGRGYYRSQRKRTIQRKRNLLYGIGGHDYWWAWTRGASGRLAKGKIHCSCPMCRSKSYDDPAIRDKRATGKSKDMISEYLREEVMPYEGNDPGKAE